MGEDPPRRVACFCCETMKLGSQAHRGAGRRFQDIDLPIGIRAVRYVEPDTSEPVSFIARPWLAAIAEAKPGAYRGAEIVVFSKDFASPMRTSETARQARFGL